MKTENYINLVDERKEYFDIRKFYTDNKNGSTKAYTTQSGTLIEEMAGEEGSWFASYSTKTGSCFSVYKEYNHKGWIHKKWAAFRNRGAAVGIKYEFNEDDGILSVSENMEKNFVFTPEEVIRYCLEHDIKLFEKGCYINRYFDHAANEFLYSISYVGMYNKSFGKIRILLNGQTGETEKVTLQKSDIPEILFIKE